MIISLTDSLDNLKAQKHKEQKKGSNDLKIDVHNIHIHTYIHTYIIYELLLFRFPPYNVICY